MSTKFSQNISDLVSRIEPSLTMSITALANKLRSDGADVIGFGAGEPDFDTPEPIKAAAIKAIESGKSKYTPASGLPELKDAICSRLESDYSIKYDPSEIVVSCGAKHSLHNVFLAILNPGDEVIVSAPYWVSYPEQIALSGASMVVAETSFETDFKVSVNQLKLLKTDRTKAIVLNSPSNPTGTIYTKEELLAISNWAVENNLWIISDEIYDKLVYNDNEHICVASLSDAIKDRVILVNGVSKSYAMTGWRIGYFAAPKPVSVAVSRLQSHTTSNPTSIAQYAAIEAFTMNQSILGDMIQKFNVRRELMVDMLSKIPGVKINDPQGAFYAFPKIDGLFGKYTKNNKKITNSIDFCEALLEDENVACVPGVGFGSDEYMRLSYATSDEMIQEGLTRITNWVNSFK